MTEKVVCVECLLQHAPAVTVSATCNCSYCFCNMQQQLLFLQHATAVTVSATCNNSYCFCNMQLQLLFLQHATTVTVSATCNCSHCFCNMQLQLLFLQHATAVTVSATCNCSYCFCNMQQQLGTDTETCIAVLVHCVRRDSMQMRLACRIKQIKGFNISCACMESNPLCILIACIAFYIDTMFHSILRTHVLYFIWFYAYMYYLSFDFMYVPVCESLHWNFLLRYFYCMWLKCVCTHGHGLLWYHLYCC